MPTSAATPAPAPTATPTSGRKQAFDDVMLPLTNEDLASPGTQKVILFMLTQSQTENVQLSGFVERFHEADKRAALLQQQCDSERRTSNAIDVIALGGTTLGGIIFALGGYFLGKNPADTASAVISFLVGIAVFVVAIVAKLGKR